MGIKRPAACRAAMPPPEEKPEGWFTKAGAVCGILAAIVGLPSVFIALYSDVSDLAAKVDYQAEELENQEEALAKQDALIRVQEAQLAEQRRQFLELRNMTAPHIADQEVAARLDRLDADIDRAAAEPSFASFGAQRSRVQQARALYDSAVQAWNARDYEAAGADIAAAYDALAGRSPDPGPAAANQALASSLRVRRVGTNNTLAWSSVGGVDGYQVWSRDSPYRLLASLPATATEYEDRDAPADAAYLVTAILAGQKLTAADVNGGEVPGYSGVPPGETADDAVASGYIPSVGVGLLAGLLALAALAARSRKP